jgi:hypothetical protein
MEKGSLDSPKTPCVVGEESRALLPAARVEEGNRASSSRNSMISDEALVEKIAYDDDNDDNNNNTGAAALTSSVHHSTDPPSLVYKKILVCRQYGLAW